MSTQRLPKAVAESAALADKVEQQLAGARADAETPAPEETPAPAPAPSVADAPKPAPEVDVEKLLQQHRTLQGQYNALMRKSQEHVSTIQQLRDKLESGPATAAVDQAALEQSLARLREQLGDELAQTLDQRIEAVVGRMLSAQVAPLKDVMSSQLASEQERMVDAFYDRLDMLAPRWEALNNDAGFAAWLKQLDPASGHTLAALLKDAENKLDAQRAAMFFTTYERELQKSQTPAPAPRPSTVATPMPVAPQQNVVRRVDIERFYQDVQRGKYRGRETEALAIEQNIMNAQREGRVVD